MICFLQRICRGESIHRSATSVKNSASSHNAMGKVFSKTQIQTMPDKAQPQPVDSPVDRGHWGGRFDFLLACLGSAVGLGNVWRFPYLCYKHGGGAFLIPYILMIFLVGIPVFLIELALGQYSAFGPLNIFINIAPFFKGIGYAMILASALVTIYYNMILAWATFYFFDSFRSDLQWKYCNHEFNTNRCFNDVEYVQCKRSATSNVYLSGNCYNESFAKLMNVSEIPAEERISPGEEYFSHYMLGQSDGVHDLGIFRWQLVLCLAAAWLVVAVSLLKGIKTSGKVVYFTATFPYVILIILFIQGVILDGAKDGLYFYLVPDFDQIHDIQVWEAAAIQVFYSFGIGGGGMITYASYNKFHNNLLRDAIIIGLADMFTSIFSGLVIFCMLGFMAKQMDKPVEDVVQSGTGLAFIAYPDGISRTSLPTLWAILFFFMLFLLGVDSQFAGVETLITFVFDRFPTTRKRKPVVVTLMCVLLFLCGLPLTTNGGIYVFELMDYYAAGWPYLFIGFLECVIIAYVYGVDTFLDDMKEMCGWSPGLLVKSHVIVIMVTVAPAVIMFIMLLSWIGFAPLRLGDYVFPGWGNYIGWVLAMAPIACIAFGAFHEALFLRWKIPWKKRLKLWFAPTSTWRSNSSENNTARFIPTRVTENSDVQNMAENSEPMFLQRNRESDESGAYDNPAVIQEL